VLILRTLVTALRCGPVSALALQDAQPLLKPEVDAQAHLRYTRPLGGVG
jgi:hypothetical protein